VFQCGADEHRSLADANVLTQLPRSPISFPVVTNYARLAEGMGRE
jgi:hypothetical protein